MVHQILDEGSNVCSTTEGIQEAFINYYDNLFTSTIQGGNVQILEGMNGRVSMAMNADLIRDVTIEEIQVAMQQMAPLKAPGPDGFPVCFYQKNWAT